MDWTQVLTIVGANIVLIMGMLGTVIALHLNSDKKISAMQKSVYDEMKDFHGRLVAIEERRIKVLEKC
jgi:hypothetical protein